MHVEQTQLSHYSQWCADVHAEKTRVIAEVLSD